MDGSSNPAREREREREREVRDRDRQRQSWLHKLWLHKQARERGGAGSWLAGWLAD